MESCDWFYEHVNEPSYFVKSRYLLFQVNIRLLVMYEMVLALALVSGNQNPVTSNVVEQRTTWEAIGCSSVLEPGRFFSVLFSEAVCHQDHSVDGGWMDNWWNCNWRGKTIVLREKLCPPRHVDLTLCVPQNITLPHPAACSDNFSLATNPFDCWYSGTERKQQYLQGEICSSVIRIILDASFPTISIVKKFLTLHRT